MGFDGSSHGVDGRGVKDSRAFRDGEEGGAVETGFTVDVCGRVQSGTLEGFVKAFVERDGGVFADGCEEGGGVVSGVF